MAVNTIRWACLSLRDCVLWHQPPTTSATCRDLEYLLIYLFACVFPTLGPKETHRQPAAWASNPTLFNQPRQGSGTNGPWTPPKCQPDEEWSKYKLPLCYKDTAHQGYQIQLWNMKNWIPKFDGKCMTPLHTVPLEPTWFTRDVCDLWYFSSFIAMHQFIFV